MVGWCGQDGQTPPQPTLLLLPPPPRAARGRFVSEIVPHPLSLKASKCLLEVWAASEVWEGCGCGSIRPRRAQHCCSGDAGLCCELSLPAAASSCRVGAPEGRLVC